MGEISALPSEVLEVIFTNLDGRSFMRCAQVCRKWRDIIRNLDKIFWKSACENEISHPTVEQLCGYQNTKDIMIKKQLWKDVYMAWIRGTMIKHSPFWKKEFQVTEYAPVTCIKISGKWILTGHRNGSIIAWEQFSGKMSHILNQHLHFVSDFVLVDVLHSGPYGDIDNYWDHHHVISVSKDPTVQVGFLLVDPSHLDCDFDIVFHYSCALEAIRVYGDRAVVCASNNTIFIFDMKYVTEPSHGLSLTKVQEVVGPSELLRSFNFWHDEIQCLCVNGLLRVFSICSGQWHAIKPYVSSHIGGEAVIPISTAYLFQNKTLFLSTVQGKLLISVNGKCTRLYHLMSTVRSSIVSIALHGSILAIGTEAGKLLLYHMPKALDLLSIDLAQPSWSSNLSEASIISIDIADDGESPVVVACTTDKIFLVQWYKERQASIKGMDTSSLFSC